MDTSYQFDFFVIGGGSGGLAAAKQAAKYNARVGLADFVKPSPQGTTWGIGGTCVNVGCIPKKLMHFAAMSGEMREDQKEAGWQTVDETGEHDWATMVGNVQMHVKKLNWGYKVELNQKNVKYFNKLAEFVDEHTIKLTDSKGNVEQVTSKYTLIAVGGRPSFPLPGIEKLVITSDDLFSLKKPPGKTLVVGASYVALECAGFLNGLGFDTTVMVRSILLRGFDQDMAERIGKYMEEKGVKFIRPTTPEAIEEVEGGKRRVTYTLNGKKEEGVFDTVLVATGRYADVQKLNLEGVKVKCDEKSGKIVCGKDDRTSNEWIYALGDAVQGRPELTPVAIKTGKLLSERLFNKGKKLMNYEFIATTVFTPLEYGCVGLSEEEAFKIYGQDSVVVYHQNFKPLEWNFLSTREADICYAKAVVYEVDDRVVGLHYLGPNAGEVIQGYAAALMLGITKEQLDSVVGIHPTTAEVDHNTYNTLRNSCNSTPSRAQTSPKRKAAEVEPPGHPYKVAGEDRMQKHIFYSTPLKHQLWCRRVAESSDHALIMTLCHNNEWLAGKSPHWRTMSGRVGSRIQDVMIHIQCLNIRPQFAFLYHYYNQSRFIQIMGCTQIKTKKQKTPRNGELVFEGEQDREQMDNQQQVQQVYDESLGRKVNVPILLNPDRNPIAIRRARFGQKRSALKNLDSRLRMSDGSILDRRLTAITLK